MNLILDTQSLIWWAIDPSRLSKKAAKAIPEAEAVFFSLGSFWELCIKAHKKNHNLPFEAGELPDFRSSLLQNGLSQLPITSENSLQASALPQHHRDPFDRLIIATAQIEDLTVISKNRNFPHYDINLLW